VRTISGFTSLARLIVFLTSSFVRNASWSRYLRFPHVGAYKRGVISLVAAKEGRA